ncbi:hypothetical protein COP1_005503 [Malus domestica]
MVEREVLGRVCSGNGRVVTEDIEAFELLDLHGSGHKLQEPVVKRTNVHQNSGLAEAQDFVVAAVADLQILKKTTFLEGKSEERDIVAGEEEDFARVVKVSVVSGGVGEGIARW